MEIMDKRKKKITFVRVIVGKAETGDIGVKKPTKSISIKNTSVEEVYDKILEMIKNATKQKI